MLNRNAQYYEWLLPYLEGGLDDARRAQMEARLRDDPALAAEADRLRRTVDGLRAAARQPLPANAQVPRDLWPRLCAQLEEPAKPAQAPARSAHGWWLTGVGATAAATLALAMVWLPGWHTPEMIATSPTTPMVSPPVGPGRTAGPPPVLPPAAPSLKTTAQPNPLTAKKAGKDAAPVRVAVLPAPTVTAPSISTTDPFVLSPAPAVTPNGTLKSTVSPRIPLPANPAPPPRARSFERMASNQRARDGVNDAAPGSPVTALGAPALIPSSPVQHQPASPPRLAMAPPAPGMDQIQNGAPTAPTPAGQAPAGKTQNEPQTKSQGHLFALIPLTGLQSANPQQHGARQDKTPAKQAAPASVMNNTLNSAAQAQALGGGAFGGGGLSNNTFGGNTQAGIDAWQSSLAAAVQTPLWGDTLGEQQTNQALLAAKESGELDNLRTRLEARRSQSPKDLVTGRMLAAVYEYGFSHESSLHERRRIANLEGAVGEDWYALAQAEQQAGNSEAARAAYRRSLECPVPPTPYHAGIARMRS